jgi:Protein of unknown function (DUF2721)
MPSFGENPFAVLTTVVAPAVLTNACSVLCLGTSNRIARVVDRSRVVATELAALAADSPQRRHWEDQLENLRHRARHLFRALRLLYAALGAFAAAALIAVLGSASTFLDSLDNGWIFHIAAALGLATGTAGVGGLLAGCGLMVHEVRLALKYIAEETEPTHRAAIL